MVHGLLVLNSSVNGSRDLWWPRDPLASRGYSVYRATDAPTNWLKLNDEPVPGQYYRDVTTLREVNMNVTPDMWVDAGELGQRCIKIPDTPYSQVVKGRPLVATNPDDVQVKVTFQDGTISTFRPAEVSGGDQLVWVRTGSSLPTGGAVSEFGLIDFTLAASFTLVYHKLTNYVNIQANMVRTFYTVVPVGDRGEEHGPGVPSTEIVDSMQVDSLDYIYREMVRRNQWLLEQVGEPAHLMFRRTSGEACGCNSDFTEGRTACPSCFETGIKGGYYGPIEALFIDPDVAAIRTIDEGGKKVERASRSYLMRTPIVQNGDMWIRRNGERLVIGNVTYKMPRGVLCQQEFDVLLLSPGDTRYLIPEYAHPDPIIYNPALTAHPPLGAEPVYNNQTMPHKHVENPTAQVGRTITFGRIRG